MRIVRRLDLDPLSPMNGGEGVRGLVPTMGAFHEGHLSLMRAARRECEIVVVSLFVNPLQFGKNEDLAAYPRDEARDAALAESAGVDTLFVPDAEELLAGSATLIEPGGVALLWEGQHRPGHFSGVATVVAKLFNIVQPDIAYFGLKDFQQCAVVAQMVRDLNFDIELRFGETVREPDGLALSSRNQYLTAEERRVAPVLNSTIEELARRVRGLDRDQADREVARARSELDQAGFATEYIEVVNEQTLKPETPRDAKCRVVVAARLGRTRLIDNVAV